MSDDTTRLSERRHTSRRRRRATSGLRRAGFAAGGLAVLVAAGLVLGSLTGADVPGVSLVLGGEDSAAPDGPSTTSSSTTSSTAGGANGSGTGSSSTKANGGTGTNGGGTASPSSPADPSAPAQPSTPNGPGSLNPTATPPAAPGSGQPTLPRTLPDAEKLASAAITAGDLGGGWKQITPGTEGVGFACDAGRTVTGDTSAARALRRPGVTVTSRNFGYNGTGAADTFASYRAAALGCNGWKISEYARSLDISVTVTQDTPDHLVISYEIKDRGHPTTYQVEHVLLAGNTLGVLSLETTAFPNEELLATLTGAADTVAARLAALGV